MWYVPTRKADSVNLLYIIYVLTLCSNLEMWKKEIEFQFCTAHVDECVYFYTFLVNIHNIYYNNDLGIHDMVLAIFS